MTSNDWPVAIRSYYRSQAVQARLAEFCGGHAKNPGSFSSWGLAGFGGVSRRFEADGGPVAFPNGELPRLCEEGADICRSLADRGGTLLVLDVDYVSSRAPEDPFIDPRTIFSRLEPVHRAIQELFGAHGINPRVVATGRGYHFAFRALAGGAFCKALVAIGARAVSSNRHSVPPEIDADWALELERGHEGAGRVLEHVAHRIVHGLRNRTEIPVTLADLPPPGGGPFICLDLSAHGDPLFTRHLRCAFSTNQKAGIWGTRGAPFVFALPRENEPLEELLRCRTDVRAAQRWAVASRATIPDVVQGTGLLDDYRHGAVARFHREFDTSSDDSPAVWPGTTVDLAEAGMPGCVVAPFERPNPLLLRPPCLRTVALGLWAMGASPRSIANLVRREYEKNHGWRPSFSNYDPASRANFYIRVLCGALADGLDSPDAFTCETQDKRGLCEPSRCSDHGRRLFSTLGLLAKERTKR